MSVRIAVSCALLLAAIPGQAEVPVGQPDEHLNELFQPHSGWIGGDGGVSAEIAPGHTVWLFSDTFVGEVRDGRRTNATMINNTAAVMSGSGPAAQVEFFVRRNSDGEAEALIVPEDGNGFFWIHAAAHANKRLLLFLVQIEKHGEGAFGFREIGRWLGVVENPLDPPVEWKIQQRKIPFTVVRPERVIGFGAATLIHDRFLYIYGVDEHRDPAAFQPGRFLIAARVPLAEAENFHAWTFLADGRWQQDFRSATPMVGEVASENSVSQIPGREQFVLVYSHRGMSKKIHVRTASDPGGPWSDPMVVYHCPEVNWDRRNFCYGAKAHESLFTRDELVLAYFTNSSDFWHVAGDARLYWPRFVRVPWSVIR